MDNHFFISHCQSTGGDQANAIYLELERLGFACWYVCTTEQFAFMLTAHTFSTRVLLIVSQKH